MSGLIITNNKTFIFRTDISDDFFMFAWDSHDENVNDRVQTHKFNDFIKGEIIEFDIDNPPETVSYQPLLN